MMLPHVLPANATRIIAVIKTGNDWTRSAILAMDYPAIQGVVIVISSLTLLVYLLLDVAQALLDPRLRA